MIGKLLRALFFIAFLPVTLPLAVLRAVGWVRRHRDDPIDLRLR